MNGKSYSDFFDDDFEVIYEEDLPEININDTRTNKLADTDSLEDYDLLENEDLEDEDPDDDEYDDRRRKKQGKKRATPDRAKKRPGQAARQTGKVPFQKQTQYPLPRKKDSADRR